MDMTLRLLASLAIYVIATGTAIATDLYPWGNHAPPFRVLVRQRDRHAPANTTNTPPRPIRLLLCALHRRRHEGPLRCCNACRLQHGAGLHCRLDPERPPSECDVSLPRDA